MRKRLTAVLRRRGTAESEAMAKKRKDNKGGPNKQAARVAKQRREQRLLEMNPLFHGRPPYDGYREWLTPNPLTRLA
ncbi:hypothetical protein [Streptomyces sp. NPDC058613]|uniref:hypothetical protein n=1 Tax=unclassified Streptomyces TaxID=2593676 RepID=UPI00365B7B49